MLQKPSRSAPWKASTNPVRRREDN
jgi:hypothetical protein